MARKYYEANGIIPTMQLLGHGSEAMTLIYIGLSQKEMANNFKKLSYD